MHRQIKRAIEWIGGPVVDRAFVIEVQTVGQLQGMVPVMIPQTDGKDVLVRVRNGRGKGLVRNRTLIELIAGAKDKVFSKLPVPADARGESVLPTLRKIPRWEEKIVVAGVNIQRIEIRELQPFAIHLHAEVIGDLNAITAAKNCWKQNLRAEIAARSGSKGSSRGGDIVDREITVVGNFDR